MEAAMWSRKEEPAELEPASDSRAAGDSGFVVTKSQAIGALAIGALAIGAVALGALAIGRLAIGRARIRRLQIDELDVGTLRVTEKLEVPEARREGESE